MGKRKGRAPITFATNECGKIAFRKRKQAREQAANWRDGDSVRVYRCRACNLWHTGHLPALVRLGVLSEQEWFGAGDEPSPLAIEVMACLRAMRRNGLQEPSFRREHDDRWVAYGLLGGELVQGAASSSPSGSTGQLIQQAKTIIDGWREQHHVT